MHGGGNIGAYSHLVKTPLGKRADRRPCSPSMPQALMAFPSKARLLISRLPRSCTLIPWLDHLLPFAVLSLEIHPSISYLPTFSWLMFFCLLTSFSLMPCPPQVLLFDALLLHVRHHDVLLAEVMSPLIFLPPLMSCSQRSCLLMFYPLMSIPRCHAS